MTRRGWSILLVVAVAVVAALLYAAFGGSADSNDNKTPIPLDDATLQFVRPTVVGMLEGVRQWELVAERMRERDGIIYLDGINLGQLYRDGDEYLTFTAETGVWTQAQDQLELRGDVRVYRQGEPLLVSERLLWDGRTEVLTSPGPVEIQHDGYTIRAGTMTGNVKDDELIFQEGVEVVSERITLRVPNQLTYHVEDGTMTGLGAGVLQFDVGSRSQQMKEESNEA